MCMHLFLLACRYTCVCVCPQGCLGCRVSGGGLDRVGPLCLCDWNFANMCIRMGVHIYCEHVCICVHVYVFIGVKKYACYVYKIIFSDGDRNGDQRPNNSFRTHGTHARAHTRTHTTHAHNAYRHVHTCI